MQVADHNAIDVTLAGGDLVDPQRLGAKLGGALELHSHVAHLQALYRLPIEIHPLGDVLDRAGAAAAPDIAGKALGMQRVLQQEFQPLALHLPAPTAVDPPNFQVQVNPVRTAGQIPNPSPRTVVPASLNRATCAADRFFPDEPGCPTAHADHRTDPARWLWDESRGRYMHRPDDAIFEFLASGRHAKFRPDRQSPPIL